MTGFHFPIAANPRLTAPRANPEFSGVVTIPTGSVALPSLTFSGDSDTGLCGPVGNTVVVTTRGTQRLRIDESGRVLIAPDTEIPVARLSLGALLSDDSLHVYDDGTSRHGFGVAAGQLRIYGAAGASLAFGSRGSSTFEAEAFRVAPISSGVNRIEVAGARVGSTPTLTAQGADADVALLIATKGTGSGAYAGFDVRGGRCLSLFGYRTPAVNYLRIGSNGAGFAPELSAWGADTDIDLLLSPKGAGLMRFGVWTSNSDASVTGYVTIRDAAGNTRKLATIA